MKEGLFLCIKQSNDISAFEEDRQTVNDDNNSQNIAQNWKITQNDTETSNDGQNGT